MDDRNTIDTCWNGEGEAWVVKTVNGFEWSVYEANSHDVGDEVFRCYDAAVDHLAETLRRHRREALREERITEAMYKLARYVACTKRCLESMEETLTGHASEEIAARIFEGYFKGMRECHNIGGE